MKKTLILALSLFGLGLFFSGHGQAYAAVNNWQKAVIIQPRSNTDFASSSFDQSVNNAVADGANTITLVIPIHQSNIYSTDVQAGSDTPTDQSIASAITYIHSKGAAAVISIHDDPWDGNWRAFVNPSDRTTWFKNYGNLLVHYASLGQTYGADEFVMGTEMTSMTDPSFSSSNTANWINMIGQVRAVYKGTLTYCAQHESYMSDFQTLQFWSYLDVMGLSAYYNMGSGDSSISFMQSQWTYWNNNSIAPIAAKYHKQVVFEELGYESKTNALADPGAAYTLSGGVDLSLQANAYQAMFQYWNNYSYMGGVAWWDWSSDPNAGGSNDTNYTPQNKPAEQVMKQWFSQGGTVTPPPTQPSAPATYTTTAQASSQPTTNSPVTIAATAKASAAISNVLIDVEVYNSSGQRVAQQSYDNQNLGTSGNQYSFPWTPTAAGTYTIEMGIFTTNWQSNLYWNSSVATFTVSSPTTSGTGGSTPPPNNGGSNPGNGGGTTTTPPPSNNQTITVWWPGNNTTVSGIQPFKALIQGLAANAYTMYWQVDGGTLNAMTDNTSPVEHKEAAVDLSSWNWSGNGQYTITFVAKDTSGNVIGTTSEVITVSH